MRTAVAIGSVCLAGGMFFSRFFGYRPYRRYHEDFPGQVGLRPGVQGQGRPEDRHRSQGVVDAQASAGPDVRPARLLGIRGRRGHAAGPAGKHGRGRPPRATATGSSRWPCRLRRRCRSTNRVATARRWHSRAAVCAVSSKSSTRRRSTGHAPLGVHRVLQTVVQGKPRSGELYNYTAHFGDYQVIITANPLLKPGQPVDARRHQARRATYWSNPSPRPRADRLSERLWAGTEY